MNAHIVILLLFLGLSAWGTAAETPYRCADAGDTDLFSAQPCADAQPALEMRDLVNRQAAEIEVLDRRIAAVQSAMVTRDVERREALNRIDRREQVLQDERSAETAAIEAEYEGDMRELEQTLAALGAARNRLVERSTQTILQGRAVR